MVSVEMLGTKATALEELKGIRIIWHITDLWKVSFSARRRGGRIGKIQKYSFFPTSPTPPSFATEYWGMNYK